MLSTANHCHLATHRQKFVAVGQSMDRNSAVKGGEQSVSCQFDGPHASSQFDVNHERPTKDIFEANEFGELNQGVHENDGHGWDTASDDSHGTPDWLDIRDILDMFHRPFPNQDGEEDQGKGSDLGE
jgi:hypothetical protein